MSARIETVGARGARRSSGRWSRLASLGLLLVALGLLLMLGGGLLWGLDVGEDIVFFGITAAVALAGAALVLYCEPHTGNKEEPANDNMVAEIVVS